MARFLVTGGAGFLGVNLVKELLQRGHEVRVIDNFSTGRRENLSPFRDEIDLIEGDIRSYHLVNQAVRGVDHVLHQGALPSVPRSIKDPITTNEVNITGTLNLLHAATEHNVKRFVYASSSSVYGDSPEASKHEALTPNPKSPYAVSKLAGEQYCRVFYQLYGLETVMLRYFNVFGPRQDPNSHYAAVIAKFVRQMRAGQRPTVHGDGSQSRDFTFVANNVTANLLATEVPGVGGEVFNIACGESFTLLDLIQALNEILGTSLEPEFGAARPGDVKHSQAAIGKAQEKLNYAPKVGFKDGLRVLVENFER